MEMMGGMLGGAFGAVGSIVGASIAADAQKYTANTNYSIALMNMYARERERTQAKFEAQRVEMKQDLGYKTPTQETRFTPGVGWETTDSPIQAALRQRQQSEQMAQFTDLAEQRKQRQDTRKQQIRERDYSSALFDQMRKERTPTATELEHLIANAGTTASNRAFDDTLRVGSREALRKGRDPGPIFREIARARSQELAGVAGNAKTQAMAMAPQLEAEQEKMNTNLYNLFATRASADPNISFSPTPLDSGGASAMAGRSNQGGELAVKAAMMEGGRMPFVPPNYGPANLAGAIGAAGQGFFRNMSGGPQYAQADPGGGDLWSSMKERVRGDQGLWSG